MKRIIVLLPILFLIGCGTMGLFSKPNETGTFKDERDGQIYKWVKIGDKVWMAQNLNFATHDGSWSYNDTKENRDVYGLLYDFNVIEDACPKGWHLPTEYEWEALEIAVGMNKTESKNVYIFRGTIAKRFLVGHSSGFDVLYGGIHKNGGFDEFGERANFWTSSRNGNPIYTRFFINGDKRIGRNLIWTANGLSVRCVKDVSIK